MSTVPHEVLAGPMSLYVAAVGEAFPAVETEPPGGNWVLVGTLGTQEYAEEGLKVMHEESLEFFRGLGSTGPLKAFRTAEELIVELTLHDLTLEQYSRVLNFNTVTDVAAAGGAAGYRRIDLYKNRDVVYRALLVRGDMSAYGDAWNFQYQIPRACPEGNPELVYTKGAPAGLLTRWRALEDLNAATVADRFGRLVMQDAAP